MSVVRYRPSSSSSDASIETATRVNSVEFAEEVGARGSGGGGGGGGGGVKERRVACSG